MRFLYSTLPVDSTAVLNASRHSAAVAAPILMSSNNSTRGERAIYRLPRLSHYTFDHNPSFCYRLDALWQVLYILRVSCLRGFVNHIHIGALHLEYLGLIGKECRPRCSSILQPSTATFMAWAFVNCQADIHSHAACACAEPRSS